VRDPLAVDRLCGEDRVGVQGVEVAGDPCERDEVGLGDRPAGRLEAEADLDVLEVVGAGPVRPALTVGSA
jgi:hypothetical protein